jgi:hypothetical protein
MNKKNFINTTIICSVIFLCALGAHAASLPPDPNNAALLYYQAFLLLPKPDYFANELINGNTTEKIYKYLRGVKLDPDPEEKIQEIEKSIHELELKMKGISPDPNKQLSPYERTIFTGKHFKEQRLGELDFLKESLEYHKKMKGVDPNKVIREHLNKCGHAIGLAQAASKIPICDWGYLYLKKYGSFSHQRYIEARKFLFILSADAMRLAADGHYDAALERCLMMRRFARHLGDLDIDIHSMSLSVDVTAFSAIRCILGSMSPDAETLVWLRDRLASTSGASESFVPALKVDYNRALQWLHTSPKTVERIRSRFIEAATYAKDKDAGEKFKNLTNEDMILLIREAASMYFNPFFDSVRREIESDKPYDQTYGELELLIYKLKSSDDFYNIAPFCDLTSIEVTPRFYNLHTNHKTMINAVKAAIEIYLILAKIGQLPETLPDGLPKDPYTLEDFKYEIIEDGFALYSQGEDFQGRGKQVFEFKVKK